MEKPQYTGPWTTIEFVVEKRTGDVIKSLTVPFSQEEIDILDQLTEIQKGWSREAIRGSGWTRELYLEATIPGCYMLRDRQEALDWMKNTLDFIRKVRDMGKERGSQEVADLSEDLNELEEGLLQFLPEERELAEGSNSVVQ